MAEPERKRKWEDAEEQKPALDAAAQAGQLDSNSLPLALDELISNPQCVIYHSGGSS